MKKLKAKWITKTQNTRLYQIPVPIIGLTGGIGTGKSTVAEILRQKNFPVIDADKLVKNIYQKDETLEFITKNFPCAVEGGRILFNKLRECAFVDPLAKKLLEDFIYAYLPAEFMKAYLAFMNPNFVIYDVPLLFEKELHKMVDVSVCVFAPKETQLDRIIIRDKCSRDLALKILENQMDIEEKKRLSNLIVSNIQSLEELEIAVEELLQKILR